MCACNNALRSDGNQAARYRHPSLSVQRSRSPVCRLCLLRCVGFHPGAVPGDSTPLRKRFFIIVTTMIIICEDTRLNSKITTAIGTMQLQYQCRPSPPPTMVSMISSLRKLLASVEVLPHTEHRIWMESQNRSPGLVHRNTRDGHHSAGCEHR